MIKNEIQSTIEKGLDFIRKETNKNIFLGFETPFVSILTYQCLNTIDSPTAKGIVGLGVEKLIKEKGANWSFNYWLKNSDQYKNEPYPDDLDDTFCALRVIYDYDPKIIKGGDYARIVNLLVACEKKVGGPYKTWLISEKENNWQEVDLAVNCNISYFLKTQKIQLKNINKLIEKSIEQEQFFSPHYKSNQVIYFIGRAYEGKYKKDLINLIKKKLKIKNNSTELSILLSTLLRLGEKVTTKSIQELIKKQNKDGSWNESDFYHYKKDIYIKNRSLTTALVIEALNLWLKNKEKRQESGNDVIIKTIIKKVKNEIKGLNKSVKNQLNTLLKKVLSGTAAEIIIFTPYLVTNCLQKEKDVDKNFLIDLGVINVLGWMAYTIYDDLIDGDKTMEWLPAANIICRKMDIMLAQLLPNNQDFLKEYKLTMDRLEEANLWEMIKCREIDGELPDYSEVEKLSDRSMGHALTSMAVLYKVGATAKDIVKLKTFFQFYLAARQMSDDAHDWETDLKKGQINSANVEILKLTKERKNYDQLRLIFWEKVFDGYAETIMNYCKKAKEAINQITCLKNTDTFDRMVNKVIKSTQMALDEKKETISFINKYYKK